MMHSSFDEALSVRRTGLQKAGLVAALVFVTLIGAFFTVVVPWAIPDVLGIPGTVSGLVLLAIYATIGPFLLCVGLLNGSRIISLPAGVPLFEVEQWGVRVFVDASNRRQEPPLEIPWSDIAFIRTGDGNHSTSELSVRTHSGQLIRLPPRLIVPERKDILERMLSSARNAGFSPEVSHRYWLIVNFKIWTLRPSSAAHGTL
jgi:hypothetical protein